MLRCLSHHHARGSHPSYAARSPQLQQPGALVKLKSFFQCIDQAKEACKLGSDSCMENLNRWPHAPHSSLLPTTMIIPPELSIRCKGKSDTATIPEQG